MKIIVYKLFSINNVFQHFLIIFERIYAYIFLYAYITRFISQIIIWVGYWLIRINGSRS